MKKGILNDCDKNSGNLWKLKPKLKNFMETQAKTQEFMETQAQILPKTQYSGKSSLLRCPKSGQKKPLT